MESRVVSRAGGKEDERREEEEVGRTRVVSLGVVERRRGMSSRPMLPEAEVMRIDLGGIFYCFLVLVVVLLSGLVDPFVWVQRCCR